MWRIMVFACCPCRSLLRGRRVILKEVPRKSAAKLPLVRNLSLKVVPVQNCVDLLTVHMQWLRRGKVRGRREVLKH